jgi:hypothetical protein
MAKHHFATINTVGHGHVTENAKKRWLKTTKRDPCEKIYYALYTVFTSEF